LKQGDYGLPFGEYRVKRNPAEGKLRQQDGYLARGSSEFSPPVRGLLQSRLTSYRRTFSLAAFEYAIATGSQEKQLPLGRLMQYPLDTGEPRIS
jgi:hypothetical protein